MGRTKHTSEERITALEQKYTTLYNRMYAYNERRDRTRRRKEQQLKNWVKRTEKFDTSDWAVLGSIVAMLRAKRGIMTFTRKESQKLRWFLKHRLTDLPEATEGKEGTE